VTSGDDPLPKIQADAVTALKAGDKDRVRVLRTMASDLKKAAIDGGVDVVRGDAATAVLRKGVKARADAAEQFEKGGRKDAADAERAEIRVIEAYLPKAASEEDVRRTVLAVIAEKSAAGPVAMGLVVKETMARLGGAADGKTVARLAAEALKK
jgi:uncharacterized protein YqeY